jgi:phosphoribosylaminoimidazole-succinocarboxamide synthase
VPGDVRGRAIAVRKLRMLPVECVVRGYITGSGWKDYQATGRVSGIELPGGLRESEKLPNPIFTPSTKAESGHDEAIDFEQGAELVGSRELMDRCARSRSRSTRSPPTTRPRAASSSPTRSSSSGSTTAAC